jgi:hypothetical protein
VSGSCSRAKSDQLRLEQRARIIDDEVADLVRSSDDRGRRASRDHTLRQRSRGLRMRRLHWLAGQRAPRRHRRSQPNPSRRITSTDVEHLPQQHRSALRAQVVGQTLGLSLGDQREFFHVQGLLLPLDFAQPIQHRRAVDR